MSKLKKSSSTHQLPTLSDSQLNFGEIRLRRIFEDAAIPIGICDGKGNFLLVNRAYAQLVGYSGEELSHLKFENIVHPDDLDRNRQLIEELLSGDRNSFEVLNRYVHRNGHEVWVHKYISVLRDATGVVTHLIGLVTDASEQNQAQRKIRENEERLRAILNSAADAIISIDQNGIIESVNPSVTRMFGYLESELLGKNIKLLMPPPFCNEHDDYLKRYLTTGEKKIIGIGRELYARRKDSSIFPIQLTVTEVDRMEVFTGFIRDISVEKEEQERLLKSERLAGLGEAMAGLVHENRNALSRVQANLRMLSRRLGDEPELLKLIDGALTASDDLGRQYEEVREYASPIRLNYSPVRLKDLVDRAWGQLVSVRDGRKTMLRMTSNETDSECIVDPFKLVNAFRNILDNSLTATEDDRVLVDVDFSATSLHTEPAIQIRFRDYGVGLSPEIAKHAMEAFVTTKIRGTGLGLAIVKRIVEAHGGRIEIEPVEPDEGTGTVVSVTIPRKPVTE